MGGGIIVVVSIISHYPPVREKFLQQMGGGAKNNDDASPGGDTKRNYNKKHIVVSFQTFICNIISYYVEWLHILGSLEYIFTGTVMEFHTYVSGTPGGQSNKVGGMTNMSEYLFGVEINHLVGGGYMTGQLSYTPLPQG